MRRPTQSMGASWSFSEISNQELLLLRIDTVQQVERDESCVRPVTLSRVPCNDPFTHMRNKK
jgi:hypothetical protein